LLLVHGRPQDGQLDKGHFLVVNWHKLLIVLGLSEYATE